MNTSQSNDFLKPEKYAGRRQARRTFAALLITLLLSSLVWACGLDNGDQGGETAPGIGIGTSTGPAGRQPTVESIQQTVSRIRGLPPTGAIPVSYIGRKQLRQELAGEIEKEYPAAELHSDEAVLKLLGLIEVDANLHSEITDLLGAGVVGFYDQETKELKVVTRNPRITPLNEIVLSHELTHGLQDQHFNLGALTENQSSNSDRDLAVLALIEGDATLVEQEYSRLVMSGADLAVAVLGSLGAIGDSRGAAPYIMRSMEFPYATGASFVSRLYQESGWESVNQAYEHPPQSTEQVMHPEKYLLAEMPQPVPGADLSAFPGNGWMLADEEVLGEFDVKEILDAQLDVREASQAAAGWGGGGLRYFSNGQQAALVLSLVWDSAQDASEFSSAMMRALEHRYGSRFDRDGAVPLLTGAWGTWAVIERNLTTVVTFAPEPPLAAGLAGAAATS